MDQKGFAPIIIVIVVTALVLGSYFVYSNYSNNRRTAPAISSPSPNSTESPTTAPSATPSAKPSPSAKAFITPLVDCVGPDGKHIQLTKRACDDFKKSWATPTPTAASTQTSLQSSGCNTSTDLGNLIVYIQPQLGQSLVGDAAVTMSNGSGDCAGHDSRLPYVQIIRQGSTSITFPSFRPGKFHIDVNYHGNNYGNDVNINPGDNSVTVTVSN